MPFITYIHLPSLIIFVHSEGPWLFAFVFFRGSVVEMLKCSVIQSVVLLQCFRWFFVLCPSLSIFVHSQLAASNPPEPSLVHHSPMAFHLSRLRAARRLRSLHFVPGGSQKFLDKALASRADALIIDLEDSVLPAEKPAARAEVGKWMASTNWGDKTVCVRINPLDTQLWEEDVEMTMKAEKPDMLVVPKVSSRDDLEKLGEKLSEVEQKLGREVGATTVLPIVSEVPEAPLRANEIARHPRVEAITWGAEDLSAELGAKRRRDGASSESSISLLDSACLKNFTEHLFIVATSCHTHLRCL